jgi:hypothetical protein
MAAQINCPLWVADAFFQAQQPQFTGIGALFSL